MLSPAGRLALAFEFVLFFLAALSFSLVSFLLLFLLSLNLLTVSIITLLLFYLCVRSIRKAVEIIRQNYNSFRFVTAI